MVTFGCIASLPYDFSYYEKMTKEQRQIPQGLSPFWPETPARYSYEKCRAKSDIAPVKNTKQIRKCYLLTWNNYTEFSFNHTRRFVRRKCSSTEIVHATRRAWFGATTRTDESHDWRREETVWERSEEFRFLLLECCSYFMIHIVLIIHTITLT